MSKTFNTLNSAASTNILQLKGHALDNISNMLTVLDELNIEENSERWNTLLDSRRELLKTLNFDVKLNSSSAKSKSSKLYFFNDMFIVGHYKKKRKKTKAVHTLKSGGTGDNFFFGDLVGRKSSETNSSSAGSGEETGSEDPDLALETRNESKVSKRSLRSKSRRSGAGKSRKSVSSQTSELPSLKLKLWMELENVYLSKISEKDDFGIRCSCTVQEAYEDEETGEVEYSTEVRRVQFFFSEDSERDEVFLQLQNIVDGLLERKIRGDSKFGEDFQSIFDNDQERSGSVVAETVDGGTLRSEKVFRSMSTLRTKSSLHSSGTTSSQGTKRSKARSYASAKRTMHQQRLNKNKKRSGTELGTLGSKYKTMTLEDIEKRYEVKLDAGDGMEGKEAEFRVTFNKQGSMGFALSSIKDGVGVFVGKLEQGGLAEIGGVTLGDRVLKVGKVEITKEMEWKDVIMLIKTQRSEEEKLIIVFSRALSVEENITKKNEEKKKEEIKQRLKAKQKENAAKKERKKSTRKGKARQWMKYKNKSGFGTRMASLRDLKERYTNEREEKLNNLKVCSEMFDDLITRSKSSKNSKQCANLLKELFKTEEKYISQLYIILDNFMKVLSSKKVPIPCRDVGFILKLQTNEKFCEHRVPRNKCKQISKIYKKKLLNKNEIKAIFGQVELVLSINETLMKSLIKGIVRLVKTKEKNQKEVTLVDAILCILPIFIEVMPFFKIYASYAYQYSNSLEVLSKLKDNEEFRKELELIEAKGQQVQGGETNGRNSMRRGAAKYEILSTMLMKPIVRLTKYPLFFRDLYEYGKKYIEEIAKVAVSTGEGDIDKLEKCLTELIEAKKTVDSIAQSVDVKVGISRDLEELYDIYVELGGYKAVKEFVQPSRRFIKKYQVLVEDKTAKKSKERNQTREYFIYLFNDLLILAVDKQNQQLTTSMKFFKTGTRAQSFMKNLGTSVIESTTKSKVGGGSKVSEKGKKKNQEPEKQQLVLVKKQVNIKFLNVRKNYVPSKDELHGFTLTETERKTSIIKTKSKKKRVSNQGIITVTGNGGGEVEEEKVFESNINRYEIWLKTKEERDELLKSINKQIKNYKKNLRAKKKITAELKPDLKRRQRQWKSKARKIKQKSIMKLEEKEMEQKKKEAKSLKEVKFQA